MTPTNISLPKGDKGDNGAVLLAGNAIAYSSIADVPTPADTVLHTADQTNIDLNAENILTKDGDEIQIEGYWEFAANANTKSIEILVGTNVVFFASGNYNGINAWVRVLVKRVNVNTIFYSWDALIGSTVSPPFSFSATQNLALGTVQVLWKQQNGTATAGDIVSKFRTVYKFKR